jgi:hypothetical protein
MPKGVGTDRAALGFELSVTVATLNTATTIVTSPPACSRDMAEIAKVPESLEIENPLHLNP